MAHRALLIALLLVLNACTTSGPLVIDHYGSTRGCYPGVAEPRRPGGAHPGTDLGAHQGAPVYAAAPGVVKHVYNGGQRYGQGVAIEHATPVGPRWTVSLHMQNVRVKAGDKVTRGQQIGEVGRVEMNSCNVHLHFEVCTTRCGGHGHYDGNLMGTENPEKYLVGCFSPNDTEEKYRGLVTDRRPLILTSPIQSCGN